DRGLTERGIAQAQALARRLEGGEIAADVLYGSTLPRARMTAEFVAQALKLPIEWDDEIQELRPGEADGMRIEDARSRFEGFRQFLTDTFTPIAPGGESWASFQLRVSAALERIVQRHPDQTIVVVTHGGVIEVSFQYFLQLPPQSRMRASFHVSNTAITHWRYVTTRAGRAEWHMAGHNDRRHLEE
ncbi:MAG TPA: histidine phosphatase family protein, partial [Roseiflexaceae bacterium]|nr:histidine phosphatase family protein [Roseiflexaceae bacterium]